MSSTLFTKVFLGIILFLVLAMGVRVIQAEQAIGASRAGFSYLVSIDNIGLIVVVVFTTAALIYHKTKKSFQKNHH